MQTFTELETLAAKMCQKVMDRRKEGKEGLLEYVRINPEEFNFLEADNSRYRTMFECAECNQATTLCKHNPLMNGSIKRTFVAPVEVQPEVQKQAPSEVDTSFKIEKVGNFELSPKRGRRVAQVFTQEQKQAWVDTYLTGLSIAQTAEKHSVGVNYVYAHITEAGVMRPKGSHLVNVVRKPKARSTNYVTPEILKKAIAQYQKGPLAGKMVQIATEMNLIPKELSDAMKAAGVAIVKGKRKVA